MINYDEYKVIGEADLEKTKDFYILVKESRGWIFRHEKCSGFDGYHPGAEEAIKNFVDWNGNTVSITQK